MNKLLSIAVLVVSYGRPSVLIQTIQDLLIQTHAPDELIVVHQCPETTDKATFQLREWAHEGRIILFETDVSHAEKARNLGLSMAKSEWILLLDDDVRVPANLVQCHLENFERDRSLDGVVGQILEKGQSPTDLLPFNYHWKHVGWMFFPLNYARRCTAVNWPSNNASIRRSLAIRAGGFDEQFDRTWLDDTDFSCRLQACGAKLVFDPLATLDHLKHPSGGSRNISSQRLWMDQSAWAVYFYFWRKNFTLWKVRRALWWNVRHVILRRAVLFRPAWFLDNLHHFIKGYRIASKRLAEGPRYFSFV